MRFLPENWRVRWMRISGLIVKEFIQIVRDPSSILIAFVMPAVLLFLIGFGISLDASHVKMAVVMESPSAVTRNLAESFASSPYFDVQYETSRQKAEQDMIAGRIRGVIVMERDFAARLARGDDAPLQVLLDGTDANTARLVSGYAQGVFLTWLQQEGLDRGLSLTPPVTPEGRVWYNPELKSRNFLIPGLIALIMTLIGTLLTALVMAREWERGTMESLMTTPVMGLDIIIGKLVPYFILGMGSMMFSVLLGVTVFGISFNGSVSVLLLASAGFLSAALSMGLLISSAARNQFVAGQMALLSSMMPGFLLSGFVFEAASAPWPIRVISHIIPATYFVSILQTIFMAGDLWREILPDLLVLFGMAAILITLTLRKTGKRLD